MKKQAISKLREKISRDENIYGIWITLESGTITEIAVALGLDYVVIDAEHGHLDWQHILQHVRAAVRSDTVVLVRVTDVQEGLIKRVLDIGADGIVVPHVETVEQLKLAVSFAKYPPKGLRGIGAERATGWGQAFAEHVAEADEAIVIPIIESIKGGENIKALATVEEVDMFYFGPADYAASAGYAGQWDVPDVNKLMEAARNILLNAGKVCGVVAITKEEIENKKREGYKMFGIGLDTWFIINGIRQLLSSMGEDRKITCDLSPVKDSAEIKEVGPPPEDYVPDRKEVIVHSGEGIVQEIAPGVISELLVGEHNKARNLFTAIVTFNEGPVDLQMHSHPHAESITLLSGKAQVIVENRRYELKPFDNITIPKYCAHYVKNLSNNKKAVFHIAAPVAKMERFISNSMNGHFIDVPEGFDGQIGPEKINRFQNARRYEAGPNTEFIDYFNDKLVPGLGMSGGYALFYKEGRLPAHIHDFDESICIIEGEAICLVEGTKYKMSNLATAMQPRGKVHYFINKNDEPMSMIWVYAGPTPERIEVADEYATIGIERSEKTLSFN